MESALFDTYNRSEITFSHGQGAWLSDMEGHQYLDLSSGLGVNVLGHNHPKLIPVLQAQLQKMIHISNSFQIPEQEKLAQKLCALSGLNKAFICNTGAEANETALKLARRHAKNKNIKRPTVIVMENAFHGRSLATLSASSSRQIQAGFEPLVEGFVRAPFNQIEAIQQIADQRDDVVAVMLEPIQGYGGIHQASASYLIALRKICDNHDWLLIADEIQCGHGRTGTYLSTQHANVTPDIVTLAKGLGGGIPIGACLTNHSIAQYMQKGSHGTTFGGNPFASLAAITTLNILEEDKLLSKVQSNGELFKETLKEMLRANSIVQDIRGQGFMIGIELTIPALPVKEKAKEYGLLIDTTAGHVIRLLPPYILSRKEIQQASDKLVKTLLYFSKS